MKRLILFSFAFCFINFTFSQNNENNKKQSLAYGIKAGYNGIQIKIVNETSDYIQKDAGVYVGGFVNIPTSEGGSIQPELIYSSSRYNSRDNLELLHLPVSYRFTLSNDFLGFIGTEAQYLLGVGNIEDSYFNDLMFGFFFGASYKITPQIHIEARPYFSFTKLLENGPTEHRRLNTLQIGLAYQF
jgi:hypothetical protein